MKINSKILSTSIIIVVVGLASYLIYQDYYKTQTQPSSENRAQTQVTGEGDLGGVSYQTGESVISDAVKNIPQPNIEGVFAVPTRYPEFYQTAMRNKIDLAMGAIKANRYDFTEWGNLAIYLKSIDYINKTAEIWEYLSKVSPGNPVYLSNLGDLYHLYLKDYPKSESRWSEAIKSDPLNAQLYLGLFNLYRYSYKIDTTAAVDTLKLGLVKIPNDLNLLTNLAGYYKEKGDLVNAKIYFQNALVQAEKLQNRPLIDAITRDLISL